MKFAAISLFVALLCTSIFWHKARRLDAWGWAELVGAAAWATFFLLMTQV